MLAKAFGLGAGRDSRVEPDGNAGRSGAQVENGAAALAGLRAEDDRDLGVAFAYAFEESAESQCGVLFRR
jgi:hypothetical protein